MVMFIRFVWKHNNICRMGCTNITISGAVMKIDELFSFGDFTGSRKEEWGWGGGVAASLFIYICPF